MKTHVLAAPLALLAMLVAAPPAHADDEAKPKATTIIVLGSVSFGLAYTAGVIGAAGADAGNNHAFDALYIPVVGPFITGVQMFAAGSQSTSAMFDGLNRAVDDIAGVFFIVDGLAQAMSVIEIAVGVARLPKKSSSAVHVAPVAGRGVTGVSASFAF